MTITSIFPTVYLKEYQVRYDPETEKLGKLVV